MKKAYEIGRRLQQARKHRGLSLEEMSRMVKNYSPQDIRQYEAGERKLCAESLLAFCFALKTDMDWVLFGVSSKKRYGVESWFATYYGSDETNSLPYDP